MYSLGETHKALVFAAVLLFALHPSGFIFEMTQKRVQRATPSPEAEEPWLLQLPWWRVCVCVCVGHVEVVFVCVRVWRCEVGESESAGEVWINEWAEMKVKTFGAGAGKEQSLSSLWHKTHRKTQHRFQRSVFYLPGSKIFTLPLWSAVKCAEEIHSELVLKDLWEYVWCCGSADVCLWVCEQKQNRSWNYSLLDQLTEHLLATTVFWKWTNLWVIFQANITI